jgi:hypothetical protein
MKLLIITAITDFAKDVKQILKNAQVHSYSYKEVNGFKNTNENSLQTNWFGSDAHENESILFYAFIPKLNVDIVIDAANDFNSKQETQSHIHVAIINIEKSN